MPDGTDPLLCRCYTSARRFPRVVGNIQGFRLPVPWTLPQLAAFISVGAALVLTRSMWAHLSPIGNALVLALVPWLAGRFARSPRLEGRSAWRAGLGWVSLQCSQLATRFSASDVDREVRVRDRIPVEVVQ